MPVNYDIYAAIQLISAIITLVLAAYIWQKRPQPGATYFSLLMVSTSIWAFAISMEMISPGVATKIFWSKISYIGIINIAPLWLLFALSYTHQDKWLKKQYIVLLWVVPLFILALVLTNEWHGLIWPAVTPISSEPGAMVIYSHGVGVWLSVFYFYSLFITGIILLIQSLIRSPKIYQKQIGIVLVGAIIPFIFNILYYLKGSPIQPLDLAPFAFSITGILFIWSIFKFRMLDVMPVAYNKLFRSTSNGIVIVNAQNRVIDMNKGAENLLNINKTSIGHDVEKVIPILDDVFPLQQVTSDLKKELFFETPHHLWLELQITPLYQEDNSSLGWLLTFEDITERKTAEKELVKSEKNYRNLVDYSLVGVYKTNLKGDLLFANNALARIFGYDSPAEMIREPIYNRYQNPDERTKVLEKLKNKGMLEYYELVMVNKSGTPLNVILNATIDGEIISGMIMDITQRKKAEEAIEKSLHEKEMLLKEIHHRVKNNLMVISSLLNLQSRYIKDKDDLQMFKESQNRAKAMAVIHDRLYQSSDLKSINFGEYIRTMANDIFHTYILDSHLVKLNLNVENVMVDINITVPLGLILNELLSNCMKYAFPQGRSGQITIEFFKKDEIFTLVVKDDGVGFPEDIDPEKSDSLGLQLINSLVDQINGKIELDRSQGTKFQIVFKEDIYH